MRRLLMAAAVVATLALGLTLGGPHGAATLHAAVQPVLSHLTADGPNTICGGSASVFC